MNGTPATRMGVLVYIPVGMSWGIYAMPGTRRTSRAALCAVHVEVYIVVPADEAQTQSQRSLIISVCSGHRLLWAHMKSPWVGCGRGESGSV